MRAVELDLAVRGQDEHAVVAQMAQQVVQQRQRSLVGPVHVVDEQQQARARRRATRRKRAVLSKRRRRSSLGDSGALGASAPSFGLDFRRELGDLGRGGAQRGAQLLGALAGAPIRGTPRRTACRAWSPRTRSSRRAGSSRRLFWACAIRSCASRVLPTPGSPDSSTRWPRACCAVVPVLAQLLLPRPRGRRAGRAPVAAAARPMRRRRLRPAAAESRTADPRRRADRCSPGPVSPRSLCAPRSRSVVPSRQLLAHPSPRQPTRAASVRRDPPPPRAGHARA